MKKIRTDNKYSPFIMQVGKGQLCVCAEADFNDRWLAALEKENLDSNGAPQLGLIISCGIERYVHVEDAVSAREKAGQVWKRIVWQFGYFPQRAAHFLEYLEEIRSALDDGK